MKPINRRSALLASSLIPGCLSRVIANAAETRAPPKYQISDAEIVFHTTADYPKRWKHLYEQTIKHYSATCGKVGPTHIFLVENPDWDPENISDDRRNKLLASQKKLKRVFAQLQGHDSDGRYLEWQTGNHWAGWSIDPAHLTITMTMSPLRDSEQFVVGPIHEYTHALQTAHGYAPEAIDGNQMGHSRWTGPAWWREGSAVLISYLYNYLHPELSRTLQHSISWSRFSHEMNRNMSLYQKGQTSIRSGVTHDDWQRLEKLDKVHPVVYAGGSVACALLLKRCGSFKQLMNFLPKVSQMGWQPAFEHHFKLTLEEFYRKFSETADKVRPEFERVPTEKNWCGFLQQMK